MKAWKMPRSQDDLSIRDIVKASHLGKATPSKIPKPTDLGKDTWTFLIPLADDAWNLAGRPAFENAFQVEAFLCSVVVNAPGFNAYTLTKRDSRAEVNLHIRCFRNYLSMPNGQSELHAAAAFYSSALGSHAPSANARGFLDYYRTRADQFSLWHSQYVLETRRRAVEGILSDAPKSHEPVITTWKPDELSAQIANVTGWYIRSSAIEAQLMGLPSEAWCGGRRFVRSGSLNLSMISFAYKRCPNTSRYGNHSRNPAPGLMLMLKAFWHRYCWKGLSSGTSLLPRFPTASS